MAIQLPDDFTLRDKSSEVSQQKKEQSKCPVSSLGSVALQQEEMETKALHGKADLTHPPADKVHQVARAAIDDSSSFSAEESEALFALMNLGSADIQMHTLKRKTGPALTLSFTISILEEMLRDKLIPDHEIDAIKKIISNYKNAFEIEKELRKSRSIAKTSSNPNDIINEKVRIQQLIYKKLEENGEVFLATGYRAEPAGHEIALQLILEELNGKKIVKGKITNKGEGVDKYHGGPIILGLTQRYVPMLTLEGTPLEALKESEFINCLIELALIECKARTNAIMPEVRESTDFTIHDFYKKGLSAWPGEKVIDPRGQTLAQTQRGPVCSLKACLEPLKAPLSHETQRHIKFRMRVKSIENFLEKGEIGSENIAHLIWARGKLNRALEKLVMQGYATEKEKLDCRILSQKINNKIAEIIVLHRIALTKKYTGQSIALKDAEEYQFQLKPPVLAQKQISGEEKAGKELIPSMSYSSSREAINNIVVAGTQIAKLTLNYQQLARQLSFEFLEALPLATDPAWLERPLSGFEAETLMMIINVIFSASCDYPNENNLLGKEVAAIANTSVGLLRAAKASGKFSKELLDMQASTTWLYIERALPQLRLSQPKEIENIKQAQVALRGIIEKFSPQVFDGIKTEKFFRTLEDVKQDLFISHIYHALQASPEYLNRDLPESMKKPRDLIERAVMLSRLDSSLRDWTPDFQWIKCMRDVTDSLFCAIGTGGKTSYGGGRFGYYYSYDEKEAASKLTRELINFRPYDKKAADPTGILIDSLYPWNDEERMFVKCLLDRRRQWDDTRTKDFQNSQINLTQKSTRFGKTVIPPHEFQQLVSILTYDETLIPQTIHYFQQFFKRLKDPRFQSLFEALFWTNGSDGKGPILAKLLSDTTTQGAEQVLSFLEEGILRAKDSNMVEQQVIFTRILAQVYTHLIDKSTSSRCQKAKALLTMSIEHLASITDPPKANIARHWLVSFYPYIKGDFSLVKICGTANAELLRSGARYDFNRRKVVSCDFDEGQNFFTRDVTTPSDRLPWWVLKSKNYILRTNPTVTKKDETYEFEDEGVPTKIIVKDNNFQILKRFNNSKGAACWFVYDPSEMFPKGTFPYDHPCRVSGLIWEQSQSWISLEEPSEALVFSAIDKSILCRIVNNQIINPKGLILAKQPYESTDLMMQKILSLDNPKNILIWKDQNGLLKEIEIPFYGLKLERDGDKWRSSKHPGFYLDLSGFIMGLEQFKHGLVLKNDEGKRLAVFPNRKVEAQKTEYRLSPHKLENSKKPELLTFHLNEIYEIEIPSDPTRLLYLIHLYLRSSDYFTASRLIDRLGKYPTTWNEQQKELCDLIDPYLQMLQDMNPYACSLRLKLRLIEHQSGAKINIEGLKTDYHACLSQINSLGEDWLSKKDELQALEILRETKQLNPIFEHRQAELEGSDKEKAFFKPVKAASDRSQSNEQPEISEELWKAMVASELLPVPIKIQPGAEFALNFFHYYAQALKRPPDKAFLDFLRLSSGSHDSLIQQLHHLLLSVVFADDPSVFGSVDELKKEGFEAFYKKHERALRRGRYNQLWKDVLTIKKHVDFEKNITPKKSIRLRRVQAIPEATIPLEGVTIQENAVVQELASRYLTCRIPENEIARLEAEISDLEALAKVYDKTEFEDPCVASNYQRTRRGIDEKISIIQREIEQWRKLDKVAFQLPEDQKVISELLSKLNQSVKQSWRTVKTMEEDLLKEIQTYPEELRVQVDGGIIKPLSVKEFIIWVGHEDDERILHANPSLRGKLKELKRQAANYMIALGDVQQLEKSAKVLFDYKLEVQTNGPDSVAAINLGENFIKIFTARRGYAGDHPKLAPLLVFECLTTLRLREEQVAPLTAYTGAELQNIELEARTGFGKSQVYIPLWLFLISRHGRLTMNTVPASLFHDQNRQLKNILGDVYDIGIHAISFDRDKATDLHYLKWLNKQLEDAQKEKRVILIDIKPLHIISGLALKESLLRQDKVNIDDLILIRKKLESILSNFIDESRECLDVRQRYDYAVGKLMNAKPVQCAQAREFFEQVVLHPDILEKWDFDFLPQRGKLTLTADNYDTLKNELADRIIAYLKLDPKIKDHLLGNVSEEALKYLDSLTLQQQRHYAWCREQLGVHLRRTLLRTCGERYNLYKEGRIPIPCHRGTPKPTSEFASLDDLFNFAIQANLKIDFKKENVEEFIDDLKIQAAIKRELIEEEPTYKLFIALKTKLRLPDLRTLTDRDLQIITQFLNSQEGFALRLSFIELTVLSKITFYPQKISGTSFTLISSQGHVQAASGTTDPDTLPPRMKPIERPSAPISNLLAIWRNSRLLPPVDETDPEKILRSILATDRNYRVLIDAAGHFTGIPEEKIIEIIFEQTAGWKPPVKGLTYYDEEGRCMLRERGSTTSIPREESTLSAKETLIFIKQSKAIGSDTPMPPSVKGLIMVGKDTSDDFFTQARGRMRGLETGQTLDIAMIKKDAEIYAKKMKVAVSDLNLIHALQYFKELEAQQRGSDYFFSLRLYLEDKVEQLLWKESGDTQKLREQFKLLEEALVTSTLSDPLKRLHSSQKRIPIKDAVKILLHSLDPLRQKAKSNSELARQLEAIEKEFDRYVDYSKLPKDIFMSESQTEEATVEIESTAQDQASEEESEQVGEGATAHSVVDFTPAAPVDWDGKNFTELFEAEKLVTASPNLKILGKEEEVGKYLKKPAYQFLIKKTAKGETQILALDLYDAKIVMQQTRSIRLFDDQAEYYLASGNDIVWSSAKDKPAKLHEIVDENITFHTKLLAGGGTLSVKERAWLRTLSKKDAERTLALIKDYQTFWPHLDSFLSQAESTISH